MVPLLVVLQAYWKAQIRSQYEKTYWHGKITILKIYCWTWYTLESEIQIIKERNKLNLDHYRAISEPYSENVNTGIRCEKLIALAKETCHMCESKPTACCIQCLRIWESVSINVSIQTQISRSYYECFAVEGGDLCPSMCCDLSFYSCSGY